MALRCAQPVECAGGADFCGGAYGVAPSAAAHS